MGLGVQVRGLGTMLAAAIVFAAGCRQENRTDSTPAAEGAERPGVAKEVVVYTALDQGFSQPILKRFEEQTGIRVLAKYDTESTKTVGLVNAIRGEKERPRCDVFWNNEIVNTIRLKQEGLLQEYRPEAAAGYPATFRDPDGMWTGFAARARVLLVNTDLVKPDQMPDSVEDLADPAWKGRTGIAKPLFGTTATHVACIHASRGADGLREFFDRLKGNDIVIESSNKSVALSVAAGKLAFGLTDTDDAIIEVDAGKPVTIVYPDSAPDQAGTLFIPNTLAIIKGAPHPEAARLLVEYLLTPEVETVLAEGPSAQIPVNPAVKARTKVKTPAEIKAMEVDFNAAATDFAAAAKLVEDYFLQ